MLAVEQAGAVLSRTLAERRPAWIAALEDDMREVRERYRGALDDLEAARGELETLTALRAWSHSPESFRPVSPAFEGLGGKRFAQIAAALRADVEGIVP